MGKERSLGSGKTRSPLAAPPLGLPLLRGCFSEQKRSLSASQRRAGLGEVLVPVCAARPPSPLLPSMINHP